MFRSGVTADKESTVVTREEPDTDIKGRKQNKTTTTTTTKDDPF